MVINQASQSDISLPKGLTELHYESQQWLSTIEFWKTEINFFKKQIDKNYLRVTLCDKMRGIEDFDNRLKEISTHALAQLEIEIRKHEHYLNKFQSGDSDVDDVTYRNIHQEESQKMLSFENDFKQFKLELFHCLEHVSD